MIMGEVTGAEEDRRGEPFVKILDFGIAQGMRVLVGGHEDSGRGPPARFANPPYSAPEHR